MYKFEEQTAKNPDELKFKLWFKLNYIYDINVYIIKNWKGIRGVDGEDYFNFLKLMQDEFKEVSLSEENRLVDNLPRGFGKAIDEYNFQETPRGKKIENPKNL